MWLRQLTYPSGYAVAPVPYTEAIRIPAPEEIVEAQLSMDMVIEKAPYYARYIDWDKINADAELLATGANVFFERVMNALDDLGVDTCHAGEIAAVLKAIGPEQLEVAFGAGGREKRGHERQSANQADQHRPDDQKNRERRFVKTEI